MAFRTKVKGKGKGNLPFPFLFCQQVDVTERYSLSLKLPAALRQVGSTP